MTPRQRELVLWLGRVDHCGRRGIMRAGWSSGTIDRCRDAGWIEYHPSFAYSFRPSQAGIREAVRK